MPSAQVSVLIAMIAVIAVIVIIVIIVVIVIIAITLLLYVITVIIAILLNKNVIGFTIILAHFPASSSHSRKKVGTWEPGSKSFFGQN